MYSRGLEIYCDVVLSVYRAKGDPMECSSYREMKLLEHATEVVERVFEHGITQQIEIDDMQFGFMNGKGTTEAIFVMCQSHCYSSVQWEGH